MCMWLGRGCHRDTQEYYLQLPALAAVGVLTGYETRLWVGGCIAGSKCSPGRACEWAALTRLIHHWVAALLIPLTHTLADTLHSVTGHLVDVVVKGGGADLISSCAVKGYIGA